MKSSNITHLQKDGKNSEDGEESGTFKEELDLLAIFAFFVRNFKHTIIITSLFTLAGLLVAYFMPKVYEYTSIIEIGKTARLIEDKNTNFKSYGYKSFKLADEVVQTLNTAVIPQATNELSALDNHKPVSISVSSPGSNNIISLNSKGTLEMQSHHTTAQNKVIETLLERHSQETKLQQLMLQTDLKETEVMLQHAKDERTLQLLTADSEQQIKNLQIDIKEVKHKQNAAQKRLAELPEIISQLEEKEISLHQRVTSLLDQSNNRADLNAERLRMEKELEFIIKQEKIARRNEQSRLINDLDILNDRKAYLSDRINLLKVQTKQRKAENSQLIANLEQEVMIKKAIYDSIIPTKVLRQPLPSNEPISPSMLVITVIATLVGGFLALILLLLKEIYIKLKTLHQ